MLDLSDAPMPARVLGFLGLVPFVAGAVGFWVLDDGNEWIVFDIVLFYGCAILSFLGAVHWGMVIAEGFDAEAIWTRMIWGVTPALLATAVSLMNALPAVFALIVGITACYVMDRRAAEFGWLPLWYARLRKPLTLVAVLALAGLMARLYWVNPPGWA